MNKNACNNFATLFQQNLKEVTEEMSVLCHRFNDQRNAKLLGAKF